MDAQPIMDQYDTQLAIIRSFTFEMERLIRHLLDERGIRVHSITSRVKEKDHVREKLSRSEDKYRDLSDVTDTSGLRIITYFSDEVDKVAQVVEEELLIDKENSVDKRDMLDPDRFGYVSLHYVVELPEQRTRLTENRRFDGMKAEIQIRSILQHTWAEIEHDLGYKTAEAVPRHIRRRFCRLAGLLEIADTEFVAIRNSLESYSASVVSKLSKSPEAILIDQASIQAYVERSDLVRRIDKKIGRAVGWALDPTPTRAANRASGLLAAGLSTVAEVDELLRENEPAIVKLAKAWIELNRGRTLTTPKKFHGGVSLHYLSLLVAARTGSLEGIVGFFDRLNPVTPKSQDKLATAKALLGAYEATQQSR